MKIEFNFFSLKQYNDILYGERFLEILNAYGFIVEKVGFYEPIKKDFDINNLKEFWTSKDIMNGFLFKGKKEFSFQGSVSWSMDLHSDERTFNGIYLEINVNKKYNMKKIIELGDDLFKWSEAVYGYISEVSKVPLFYSTGNESCSIGNIYNGISSIFWVNYFGPEYFQKPNFHVINEHQMLNHGIRITLTDTPDDERLSDLDFITDCKKQIGIEWFWCYPCNYKINVPKFDRSSLALY